VRKLALLALVTFSFLPVAASAQQPPAPPSVTLPGSFWIAVGDVGPAEPDNTIGQASLQQGVTAWRHGSWFFVPFVGASVTADSEGYEWNDRHPVTVAVKLQRTIGNGVVHAGGGVLFERDPATGRDRHPTAFAGYWAGWQLDRQAHLGTWPVALPGSINAASGLLTGRDPHNWMTYVSVQQGVTVFRVKGIAAVPYASLGASFDSKGRPWENRARSDAGVKLVRAITGGVIEAGVAQRFQRELKSGHQTSAPVVFVNLWIGWNPSTTSLR
jgi:hypothetical protein